MTAKEQRPMTETHHGVLDLAFAEGHGEARLAAEPAAPGQSPGQVLDSLYTELCRRYGPIKTPATLTFTLVIEP